MLARGLAPAFAMLFDQDGNRKYMIEPEWRAFLAAADKADPDTRSFCWSLARTGGRLSEVLSLTPRSFDLDNGTIRIRCLKRRAPDVFRELPLGLSFLELMEATVSVTARRIDPSLVDVPIWRWCRTTGWQRVKHVAQRAGLPAHLCTPKALRHTFGIEGVLMKNIPLGTMQKWMGHARIESTVIYTTAVGREERMLSTRMWV